ncbi:MAG: twin-arginine translocase subunit TatC, partial [Bacillota bacterium]|nr:twin-arginine translocase subunit TatC [Bacillota bacterium]
MVSFSFVRRLSGLLSSLGGGVDLVYISPAEVLVTDVRLAFVAGLFLSLPVIAHQVWSFICPALHRREKVYVFLMMFLSILLFILGSAFAYGVVLPTTMAFFTGFAGPGLNPLISYDRYITFITSLTTMFGLVFQMPLIVVFLTWAGVLTPEALRRGRKTAVFLLFVAAAILTPPDVISQLLMAVPMLVLYEVSLLLAVAASRRKTRPHA